MEKKEKQDKQSYWLYALLTVPVVVVLVFAVCAVHITMNRKDPKYIPPQTQSEVDVAGQTGVVNGSAETSQQIEQKQQALDRQGTFVIHKTAGTGGLPKSVVCKYGVMIDGATGEILAARNARDRMNPASMTKILTVLVASEHVTSEQLEDEVEITNETKDYCYRNDCSIAGFEVGEKVPVRDLFYATILPSGADAAVTLATYVAGSHEAFVDMMNAKLEELGIVDSSHFTNCVGLYDENHYSTVCDIALILRTASENEWCRKVLSTHIYTTTKTDRHPDGLTLSNLFLRRIEDQDTHGTVLCAKTGYVSQSGNCAASLALDDSGKEYICVTGGSPGSWRCIYDHTDIYSKFLSEPSGHPDSVY